MNFYYFIFKYFINLVIETCAKLFGFFYLRPNVLSYKLSSLCILCTLSAIFLDNLESGLYILVTMLERINKKFRFDKFRWYLVVFSPQQISIENLGGLSLICYSGSSSGSVHLCVTVCLAQNLWARSFYLPFMLPLDDTLILFLPKQILIENFHQIQYDRNYSEWMNEWTI